MLANGMGGLDWAGLPFVVDHLGIQDVDLFVHKLRVILRRRAQRTQQDE